MKKIIIALSLLISSVGAFAATKYNCGDESGQFVVTFSFDKNHAQFTYFTDGMNEEYMLKLPMKFIKSNGSKNIYVANYNPGTITIVFPKVVPESSSFNVEVRSGDLFPCDDGKLIFDCEEEMD